MKVYESEVCVVGPARRAWRASIGLALANAPFVLVDAGNGPVTEPH